MDKQYHQFIREMIRQKERASETTKPGLPPGQLAHDLALLLLHKGYAVSADMSEERQCADIYARYLRLTAELGQLFSAQRIPEETVN